MRLVFDRSPPRVDWLVTDGSPYHEPFFEDSVRRLRRLASNHGAPAHSTSIEHLAALARPTPPTAFVFHVSRCGSTLVARMLAQLAGSVVLSEAPILDQVLRARHHGADVSDEDRTAWLRGVVGALTRAVDGAPTRVFVKVDCWHLFELHIVRKAFPDTPFVFLYRHPLEVIVSLMRVPSLALVRGTLTPDELGLSVEERDALSPAELAAAVLGAFYRTATQHRNQLTPVAYRDLPDRIWAGLPGCRLEDDEVERMKRVARWDAKRPRQPFTPDSSDKRRSVDDTLRTAYARWTKPHYERWLEAAGPVHRARR